MVGRGRPKRKAWGGNLRYSGLESKAGRRLDLQSGKAMERIQALRLFVRVVDLGSFSKAAGEIGLGQPAATKQVAQLERQLGARLLHRSTHGVSPTEVGQLYYDKCRLILHHVEEAESVASLLQSQLSGVLRITCSVAFGRRVLAPLAMRFMRANPTLRVDLSFDDRYVNLVEQGLDLAVRMGRLADSTLGARYLGMNPWVIVAAPAYLAAHEAPSQPDQLAAHDVLIYTTVQGDSRWSLNGPSGATVSVPVSGRMRSNNLSTLLAAAREGMGIAALPRYVAHEAIEAGAVLPLLQEWSLPAQEVHAVYPSPRMVPAKVTEFIAWLQAQFEGEWWSRA
jgi:DNA-binding transcriptional LysR family regulator